MSRVIVVEGHCLRKGCVLFLFESITNQEYDEILLSFLRWEQWFIGSIEDTFKIYYLGDKSTNCFSHKILYKHKNLLSTIHDSIRQIPETVWILSKNIWEKEKVSLANNCKQVIFNRSAVQGHSTWKGNIPSFHFSFQKKHFFFFSNVRNVRTLRNFQYLSMMSTMFFCFSFCFLLCWCFLFCW